MGKQFTITDIVDGHCVNSGTRWYSVKYDGAHLRMVSDDGKRVSENSLLGRSIRRAVREHVQRSNSAQCVHASDHR